MLVQLAVRLQHSSQPGAGHKSEHNGAARSLRPSAALASLEGEGRTYELAITARVVSEELRLRLPEVWLESGLTTNR